MIPELCTSCESMTHTLHRVSLSCSIPNLCCRPDRSRNGSQRHQSSSRAIYPPNGFTRHEEQRVVYVAPPRCLRLGTRRPLRISPSQQVGSCWVVDHLFSRLCRVRHVHSRFTTRWDVSFRVWSRISGWMPWGMWIFVEWMVGDDGFL